MTFNKYYNQITKDIDKALGIPEERLEFFKSYFTDYTSNIIYCIRVPGCTIGYVKVDVNMIIQELEIYNDLKIVTFECDINEQLKSYIGTKLEGIL